VPESAEVAAYYVVAEALTNAAKYARASEVRVSIEARRSELVAFHYRRRDWWCGLTQGSGLIGLIDRVEALGGKLRISSVVGHVITGDDPGRGILTVISRLPADSG